jgi:signal peptide peptidase SppA
MPKDFKRSTRRIVSAVMGTPWMLLESSLHQMVSVLELRANGAVLTREEVAAKLRESDHGQGVCKARGLNFNPQDSDDFDGPCVVDGGIACLPMTGILAPRLSWMDELSGGTSTELFAQWYKQALSDARVTQILTWIDSPGGSASGNEELSMMIRQARGMKPAVAVARGMIASAAYYNGSAFQTLYASPSTEVGSVGCYMIHGESSIADKEDGYTYTVIKAGENKAAGNSVEPLSPTTKGVLQERIDSFYDQFVAAVATNRGTTTAKVEEAFGQGKVMIADQALAAGMIDGVRTFDEVLAELQSLSKTKSAAKPVRGGSGSNSRTEAKEVPMDKIKAALVKMGLVDEKDDDKIVQAMCKSFCKARGVEVPKDEAALLALLESEAPKPASTSTVVTTQPSQPAAGAQGGTSNPSSGGSAKNDETIRQAERARGANIRAAGQLLHMSDDKIQEAIDSGKDMDSIMTEWRTTKGESEKPVGKVAAGKQQTENLTQGAVESLSQRCGLLAADKMAPESKDLRGLTMVELGRVMLADRGTRLIGMTDEDVAKALLGNTQFGETLVIRSDAPGYQRPGDYPGILSALVGKMLDAAEELGETTFREWTGTMPAVPDFKPKTVHSIGEFGELPVHEDAKPFDQSTNTEEASWLAVDEYADEWALTPRMVVNDDLDVLTDVVQGKQTAHDMTMERLCVNLLHANAVAQDGTALFHDGAHGNDIEAGSGAAPDTAQLALMRKKLRKIYGISGKVKLNQTLSLLLVPEDLETAAEKLLAPALTIVPTTEANGQIFRGKCKWLVVPMLSENSLAVYYGISTSRRKAIVRAHQRGYERMRTVSYYDPKTDCRIWRFAGRMAAAIRTFRTIIRNAGA